MTYPEFIGIVLVSEREDCSHHRKLCFR